MSRRVKVSKEEEALIKRLMHKGYPTGEIARMVGVAERDVIFTIYGKTR